MISQSLQSIQQILAIDLTDQEYKLFFLISPTWQIKPQYFGNLEESDFALGCLDYFKNIEPEYQAIEQYLEGYNSSEHLLYQVYHCDWCCN